MRFGLACVLVSVIGCGGSHSTLQPGGDDGGDDQPIDAGIDADLGLQPPTMGFQLKSHVIDVQPGEDKTWCDYMLLPNADVVEIQKWESELTEGVQGVVLYTTSTEMKSAGSLSSDGCGYTSSRAPIWAYQTQERRAEMAFPANDGNGRPIGVPLRARQPAYLQIHVVNTGTEVLHAQVTINGNTYPAGMQVTEAAPYVAYLDGFTIPGGTEAAPSTQSITKACRLPTDVKFISMSTHTFRHGAGTMVTDTPTAGAATTLFQGTDWKKPNDVSMIPATFYSFAGKLTFSCQYANTEGRTINTGDNAATDEMCLAVGFYFPSPGGQGGFCLNGVITR